jgi:ArsR family metal-binding transcriptional regulator
LAEEDHVLIESYDLEITVSTHSDVEFEYEAIAHLAVDIGPAMPYLNALLSRGIYLPGKPALSWRHEGRNIGFWARRIAVDNLESREQAAEVVERLVSMVNAAWERRDEIEPDHTTHRQLQPLAIHRLLPKTNCKVCGEATCFNFALKLVAGQASMALCRPLYEDVRWEEQRAQLEHMVATRWPAL